MSIYIYNTIFNVHSNGNNDLHCILVSTGTVRDAFESRKKYKLRKFNTLILIVKLKWYKTHSIGREIMSTNLV